MTSKSGTTTPLSLSWSTVASVSWSPLTATVADLRAGRGLVLDEAALGDGAVGADVAGDRAHRERVLAEVLLEQGVHRRAHPGADLAALGVGLGEHDPLALPRCQRVGVDGEYLDGKTRRWPPRTLCALAGIRSVFFTMNGWTCSAISSASGLLKLSSSMPGIG